MYGTVDVALAPDGEIWALPDRTLDAGLSGCLAFDKDQFTWQSDPADLRALSGRRAPRSRQPLESPGDHVAGSGHPDRASRSARPGRDTAVIEGVEGGMLGYGATTDPVRYFVLPTVLGAARAHPSSPAS
ncbi:MAG: hypothetical protein R2991_10755 [Thermoanaerobaculia bacterium]